jgi:flagellar assembly protein FliH
MTLLSKEYSHMALIKRADSDIYANSAIVLNLGNLEAEGDAVITRARNNAQAITAKALLDQKGLLDETEEMAKVKGTKNGWKAGYQKGYSQGRKEAKNKVASEAEDLVQAWSSALKEFEVNRSELLENAKEDIMVLACEIAKRVTGRYIELHPESLKFQLEEILAVVIQPTKLRIAVNSEDFSLLSDILPDLQYLLNSSTEVKIETNTLLPRGSCVGHTERQGIIDSSIDTRLTRIVRTLLPRDNINDESST